MKIFQLLWNVELGIPLEDILEDIGGYFLFLFKWLTYSICSVNIVDQWILIIHQTNAVFSVNLSTINIWATSLDFQPNPFFLKLCCFYIVSTLFYIWTLFNLIIRVGINHYSKPLNCVNSLNDSLHTLVSKAVLTCMIQLKKNAGATFHSIFLKKVLGFIQGFSDPGLCMTDVFLRNIISYYDTVTM